MKLLNFILMRRSNMKMIFLSYAKS